MTDHLIDVIARTTVVVLLNGLWQALVIAGVTWLALRLSPKVNASTRYAAWTLALIASLVLPLLTSATHVVYETSAEKAQSQTLPAHRTAAKPPAAQVSAAARPQQTSAQSVALPQVPNLRVAPPAILVIALFALWALAALALVVRLAVALFRLEKLKHDSLPLRMEYREQLVKYQHVSAQQRDVRICVTEGIEVPVAVGLFDAMVLLPQHLLDTLEAGEIDQISLHELAHLLRHDDWTNGLQRVVSALLFFNPAVWFIARQMDIEREVACDDYVLELTGAVRSYAFCLTKMAEMTAWPHQPLAAPGVFITRKNISIRIERLLRTGRAISSSISPATAVAVLAGLAMVFAIARAVTPVVAFALPVAPTPVPVAEASTPPKPAHPSTPAKPAAAKAPATAEPAASAAPPIHTHSESIVHPGVTAKPRVVSVAVPAVSVPPVMVPGVNVPPVRVAVDTAVASTTGLNCSGCDFSRGQLAGKDFSSSNLSGSDFEGADLHGARFTNANVSGANFAHANLRGVNFNGANMTGCDLDGADTTGANFDGANMSGCSFDAHKLSPDQSRFFLEHCTGCDFTGGRFDGMNLRRLHVTGVDMTHASFRNADLTGSEFTGIDFSGADFTGAILNGATFRGCDFSGANLRSVDLSHVNFVGSSLSGAIMNR
jgi:uncharacterized protein YjbI with pentapeptide repeats/beta-lactamase regulating signal transducer with metallopeptidase domain